MGYNIIILYYIYILYIYIIYYNIIILILGPLDKKPKRDYLKQEFIF